MPTAVQKWEKQWFFYPWNQFHDPFFCPSPTPLDCGCSSIPSPQPHSLQPPRPLSSGFKSSKGETREFSLILVQKYFPHPQPLNQSLRTIAPHRHQATAQKSCKAALASQRLSESHESPSKPCVLTELTVSAPQEGVLMKGCCQNSHLCVLRSRRCRGFLKMPEFATLHDDKRGFRNIMTHSRCFCRSRGLQCEDEVSLFQTTLFQHSG